MVSADLPISAQFLKFAVSIPSFDRRLDILDGLDIVAGPGDSVF